MPDEVVITLLVETGTGVWVGATGAGSMAIFSWALAHLEFSVKGNPAETDLVPQ
jgi:hypothetical protein